MLDRHSHILYGLDDGAPDLKTSVAMLRAAKLAGVTSIVATPHVINTAFDIALAKERKNELIPYANDIGIELLLGYEVHWRAFSQIPFEEASAFCCEKTNEILIEFSMSSMLPKNMMKGIFALQRAGLQVIIAHPERYECVQKEMSITNEWQEMGCWLQLDANVLTTLPLDPARRCAMKLLKQKIYHCYASDAHCEGDYIRFQKAAAWIIRRFGGLEDEQ
jgi:protein-tyrosine phosphatase